jgi:hypothetical protein
LRRMAANQLLSQRRHPANRDRSSHPQQDRHQQTVLEVSDHPLFGTILDNYPAMTSFLNWVAGMSVVGTLIGILPHVAAGLGVIWYLVLLYDRFISKRRRLSK